MFIHIGDKKIVSDRRIVGIFNIDTLSKSKENEYYLRFIEDGDKTIIIDRSNKTLSSKVSPFTIISRNSIEDFIWRKTDE